MAIKHTFASAKADGTDATLVQPSNWNSNHVIDSEVTFPAVTSPATPAAGNFNLFGHTLGNTRTMAAVIGPSGMDYPLQPSMWRQKVGRWNPSGNSTTLPGVDGFIAWTAVGTPTARNVTTTNRLTRMRRIQYPSSGTAGSLCSLRSGSAQFSTGTGSGDGGFFYSVRFAVTDAAAVTGARMFVGMSGTTTVPTNVDPAILINCFGIAQLNTDASQLYFVYGGSAAQTAIALGTGFPPANTTVPYDLMLWCPPSSNGVVNYQLERIDTGTSIGGTITPTTPGIQTPANTTLLNPVIWRSNNATALAVSLDLISAYIETDY
jgi:hypothetical protein